MRELARRLESPSAPMLPADRALVNKWLTDTLGRAEPFTPDTEMFFSDPLHGDQNDRVALAIKLLAEMHPNAVKRVASMGLARQPDPTVLGVWTKNLRGLPMIQISPTRPTEDALPALDRARSVEEYQRGADRMRRRPMTFLEAMDIGRHELAHAMGLPDYTGPGRGLDASDIQALSQLLHRDTYLPRER